MVAETHQGGPILVWPVYRSVGSARPPTLAGLPGLFALRAVAGAGAVAAAAPARGADAGAGAGVAGAGLAGDGPAAPAGRSWTSRCWPRCWGAGCRAPRRCGRGLGRFPARARAGGGRGGLRGRAGPAARAGVGGDRRAPGAVLGPGQAGRASRRAGRAATAGGCAATGSTWPSTRHRARSSRSCWPAGRMRDHRLAGAAGPPLPGGARPPAGRGGRRLRLHQPGLGRGAGRQRRAVHPRLRPLGPGQGAPGRPLAPAAPLARRRRRGPPGRLPLGRPPAPVRARRPLPDRQARPLGLRHQPARRRPAGAWPAPTASGGGSSR